MSALAAARDALARALRRGGGERGAREHAAFAALRRAGRRGLRRRRAARRRSTRSGATRTSRALAAHRVRSSAPTARPRSRATPSRRSRARSSRAALFVFVGRALRARALDAPRRPTVEAASRSRRPRRRRAPPRSARSSTAKQHPFAALDTRAPRRRRVHPAAGRRAPRRSRSTSCSSRRGAGDAHAPPSRASWSRPARGSHARRGAGPRLARRRGPRFTNAVTEVARRRRARALELVLLQRESDATFHVSKRAARLERDARFATRTLTLGGALRAQRPRACCSPGEGAEATLDGLFLGARRAARRQPHASSTTPCRTARAASSTRASSRDRSRGVFRGRVLVRPDAQKTDARSRTRTCCSRDGAEIDTQAAARDLRRRREVQPRLRDRPARRERALLPALARHRRGRGARPADARLRGRGARRAARSAPLAEALGDAFAGAPRGAALDERAPPDRAPARRRRASARDFPILARTQRGKPLVYLDSAASAQKPRAVIDAISRLLRGPSYANIHRGVYELSERATRALRGGAREACAASSARATRARSSSCATPPRRSTSSPGAAGAPAASAPATRCCVTEHGAPRQHRALAARSARSAARASRVAPIDDARRARARRASRRCSPSARSSSPSRTSRTCSARCNPVREIAALAHARRRARAGGRRAGGAAHAGRRARARLRLLRLLGPQALRPDAGSARSTRAPSCSRRCRPGRAAAT